MKISQRPGKSQQGKTSPLFCPLLSFHVLCNCIICHQFPQTRGIKGRVRKRARPPFTVPLFPFRNRESRAPADPQAAGQRLDQGLGLQRRGALPPRLRVARRLKPDAASRLICIAIRDIVFFRACSLEELNDLIDALSPLTTPLASRRWRHV